MAKHSPTHPQHAPKAIEPTDEPTTRVSKAPEHTDATLIHGLLNDVVTLVARIDELERQLAEIKRRM